MIEDLFAPLFLGELFLGTNFNDARSNPKNKYLIFWNMKIIHYSGSFINKNLSNFFVKCKKSTLRFKWINVGESETNKKRTLSV